MTAIAIILLVGNSVIDKEKSKDNFQNMEQSFTIIQSDLNQLALNGAPVKTTRVHMEDGSLGIINNAAKIQVNYDGSTRYDQYTGQIIFTQGNDLTNNISIENGGVWKASDGYTFITSQPRMYITPQTKTLVLNIYRMSADSSPVVNSGIGMMNLEMRYVSTDVSPLYSHPGGSAELKIDTAYPEAWKEYLTNMANVPGVTVSFTPYSSGVDATLDGVDNLLISEHQIKLSMSGIYV